MIEVRNDDRNVLDEIVGHQCYVHLERMASNYFCLIVEDGTRRLMVNLGAFNHRPSQGNRVTATIYADEAPRGAVQPQGDA